RGASGAAPGAAGGAAANAGPGPRPDRTRDQVCVHPDPAHEPLPGVADPCPDDDLGPPAVRRPPLDRAAELAPDQRGDDLRPETAQDTALLPAAAVVADGGLQPLAVPLRTDDAGAALPSQPVLDGAGDELGEHHGQRCRVVGRDLPEAALPLG